MAVFDKEAYLLATFLDFSRYWTDKDVHFLETMVHTLHFGQPEMKKEAAKFLIQFKANEDAWKRISEVFRWSKHSETKYFLLDIFSQYTLLNWRHFSCHQRLGFKKYIVTLVMAATDVDKLIAYKKEDQKIMSKLNYVLLKIFDYEYPDNWPTFIEDLFNASKTNDVRCLNSLLLLKSMSQKILGTSQKMSGVKFKEIRENNADIFSHIFFLCEYVLNTSSEVLLLKYALETVKKFLIFIPPILVYETHFIKVLIDKLSSVPDKCLILALLNAIVKLCPPKCSIRLVFLFSQYVNCQKKVLNLPGNFKEIYSQSSDLFRKEVYCQTVVLTNILKHHGEKIRKGVFLSFEAALCSLISISSLDDVTLIKLCMDYFYVLVRHLSLEKHRKGTYEHKYLISRLRHLIITGFIKPENTIHKNDKGQVITETYKPDSQQIFTNMKLILVFLTYLDHVETSKIIVQELYKLIKSREFSEKRLTSLCCAALSIRGKFVRLKGPLIRCMPIKIEKKLFWTILKGLLTLTKVIKGKSNKKLLAFNLMNVIGEYAVHLNSRWDILKRIITKLSDFMHDKEKDTKALACKTFISVAQKCKIKFLEHQPGEDMPYYDKILERMSELPSILSASQVFDFYEAVSYITVADFPQGDEKVIKARIQRFMSAKNVHFGKILKQITLKSHLVFHHPKFIKDVIYMLHLNLSVCKGMGFEYVHQLHNIFKDMMLLYENLTKKIYKIVEKKRDAEVVKHPTIHGMRRVRKEILTLISTWIKTIKEQSQHATFLEYFLPYLKCCVIRDYSTCTVPSLHEPEVLALLTAIVTALKESALKQIEIFCSFVLDSSAGLVLQVNNQKEFLVLNENFIKFIHAVVTHCFKALEDMFKREKDINFEKILDVILWSTKIQNDEIATLGLQTLLLLLEKIRLSDKKQLFYQTFYIIILENILFLITNPLHRSLDVQQKSGILSHMLGLILSDIKKPINPILQKDGIRNVTYIQHYAAKYFYMEFKDLTEQQLKLVVNGLFKLHKNIPLLGKYIDNLPLLIQEFCEENAERGITKAITNCNKAEANKENVQKVPKDNIRSISS